jgi:hypothetical protein
MATYDHLPVYKTSYDLLTEIFRFSQNFKREYKFTIGESLKNETITMITNIYRANSTYEKQSPIEKAKENIEIIRLFFRLLKDLQQINLKKFIDINEKVESVSKQLTAWKKYNENKANTQPELPVAKA